MLDVDAIRQRFPALSRVHDGRPIVFADAPGASQLPDSVIEAMRGHLRRGVSNDHGAFALSRETDALIADARGAAADLVGAAPAEIVFGANTTTMLFALSRSFARTLPPGDEVVVTALDHDANIRPWVLAAADAGAEVRWVEVRDQDVTLDLDSFERALSSRTRLVAFTLASNAVGTVTPAADLIRMARDAGAVVAVDGVHLAQHAALDLHGLGADILACSMYKVFGPHVGVLALRAELLDAWMPYRLRPASDDAPERWETGTQNHEGLAGLVAAVDYIAELGGSDGVTEGTGRRQRVLAGYGAIQEHERSLATRFLEGLDRLPGVRLWGIRDPARAGERTPTFAIRVEGQKPAETAAALDRRGIFVWDGNYYAVELMERLGLEATGGAVRVGFCHYHGTSDVDRVLDALGDLQQARGEAR
jgi:cysteine desulfurase family protein (TIGR01976 family)